MPSQADSSLRKKYHTQNCDIAHPQTATLRLTHMHHGGQSIVFRLISTDNLHKVYAYNRADNDKRSLHFHNCAFHKEWQRYMHHDLCFRIV